MSFEDELDLLDEYNRWKAAKEVSSVDVTPTQFMIERAQDEALRRLEKIHAFLNELDPENIHQRDAGELREGILEMLGD